MTGAQYENEVAKNMYRGTGSSLYPIRAGYSGNGAYPLPDVAVHDQHTGILHHLEIKHVATDTASVEEEDDLQQLDALRGPNAKAWLVIKFSRRAPLTIPLLDHREKEFETIAHKLVFTMNKMDVLGTFNPRVRTAESGITRLYIDKPDLDNWISATEADDDYEEILSSMGLHG